MNMFFRVENALWAVHSSTSRGHFFVWEKPVARTGQIINLLLSVIYCNLSLAGMQRLFRGKKYLSGLYADGTFRKVFVPEQDMGHPNRTDPNFAASFRSGKKPI